MSIPYGVELRGEMSFVLFIVVKSVRCLHDFPNWLVQVQVHCTPVVMTQEESVS